MAFSFVVEDGTGLTGATSYVTLAEADDYVTSNIHAAPKWTSLTVGDRQRLLVWASRFLDQHAIWFGEKTVETSGLRWPRTCVEDVDGVAIADNVVPKQLKQATIEMARYLIEQDRTTERGQDGLKELQVDVVRLVFDEAYRLAKVPNDIAYIIRGIGTIGSGRPQFAKINRM